MTLEARPLTRPLRPTLVRVLGAWDGASITIGATLGTAIFLTPSDIARALPHPGLILATWLAGGLLTLTGALTYAELGAMFPRAGGQYHFLKEAYGRLSGFLFGWASFLVIMSGGIAAIAAGFGEYLGVFIPFFSTRHVLFSLPLPFWTWTVRGGQLAGAIGIALLTVLNCAGVKAGASVQNLMTLVKIGSVLGFVLLGFSVGAPVSPQLAGALRPIEILPAFGIALIAVLWAYDGWYVLTFSAGEMKDPGRSLPWGLISGTLTVMLLYGLVNFVYLRALPLDAISRSPHIGEDAATALFGPGAARLVSLAVLVSMFGCLAANILCCSRIYQPMAEDGLFFAALARIGPRHAVPLRSLVAQGVWSATLVLSGTFQQLYTYVVFVEVLIFAATGAAIFVLRRRRPEAPRPYRTWGYPWVPAFFMLSSLALAANTLREKPVESSIGMGLLAAGLPAYAAWRRKSERQSQPEPTG